MIMITKDLKYSVNQKRHLEDNAKPECLLNSAKRSLS